MNEGQPVADLKPSGLGRDDALAFLRSNSRYTLIAVIALLGLVVSGALYLSSVGTPKGSPLAAWEWPLVAVLILGGLPLAIELVASLLKREFGSDLIAGVSIVASVALHQYLAGAVVVLMLSGGQALESYATGRASSVLEALAKRMPSVAHVRSGQELKDTALSEVGIDTEVVVFPHETCPVDGIVVEGHGIMDESYLTGEPYMIPKAPGSGVLSGAINGESALTVRVTELAQDSRYSKIMEVMRSSAQHRPKMRRIADQLGAFYTPSALLIALAAWAISGNPLRFLAVIVIATPCPLLIAIPVAIIGSISLAAKRGIVIKDPAVLEKIDTCRVAIFDKTGTLTYGRPELTEVLPASGFSETEILTLAAGLERYSKHPLAAPILERAEKEGLAMVEAVAISEKPGQGLRGTLEGREVEITSRKKAIARLPALSEALPPMAGGMECVVLVDDAYAATLRFRDEPRPDGLNFVKHLGTRHHFSRVILLSGDRESEARYLADRVGIKEVYSGQSPEQKLDLVRQETASAKTIFVGDGINDAPALTAATVGIAFGQNSDVTSAAAGAIVLDSSLERVDELMHLGRRMRTIALQSAYGGMALSIAGMLVASVGLLTPVFGALSQEVIDILAVLNALRAAFQPRSLTDY